MKNRKGNISCPKKGETIETTEVINTTKEKVRNIATLLKKMVSDNDSDENDDEVVSIAMKEESDEDDKIELITHVKNNDGWIIDSGCSYHMTGDTSKFENL